MSRRRCIRTSSTPPPSNRSGIASMKPGRATCRVFYRPGETLAPQFQLGRHALRAGAGGADAVLIGSRPVYRHDRHDDETFRRLLGLASGRGVGIEHAFVDPVARPGLLLCHCSSFAIRTGSRYGGTEEAGKDRYPSLAALYGDDTGAM